MISFFKKNRWRRHLGFWGSMVALAGIPITGQNPILGVCMCLGGLAAAVCASEIPYSID